MWPAGLAADLGFKFGVVVSSTAAAAPHAKAVCKWSVQPMTIKNFWVLSTSYPFHHYNITFFIHATYSTSKWQT